MRFAQGSSPTSANLHRCNLKKGKTLFHILSFSFLYLFLSVRNIIAEMSRCFVQGNVATVTTEGYITGKIPKETKGNGEVGKSNEFSGCLVPLFRLRPFSYLLAISSSRGAVKSFVWTTRKGSRGPRYFPRKVSTRRKFNGFIDHANFRLGQRRILKKNLFGRKLYLNADLVFIHYSLVKSPLYLIRLGLYVESYFFFLL